MLEKCSLSNFASTCTFYFHLKTQTCVSRRKRSQMLHQLRWIVAPRVPLHLDRGMHRHIKGCVGSWIFARPITSPFPCGCIAGTDSAQQEAVRKRFSLCVCVCFVYMWVFTPIYVCDDREIILHNGLKVIREKDWSPCLNNFALFNPQKGFAWSCCRSSHKIHQDMAFSWLFY